MRLRPMCRPSSRQWRCGESAHDMAVEARAWREASTRLNQDRPHELQQARAEAPARSPSAKNGEACRGATPLSDVAGARAPVPHGTGSRSRRSAWARSHQSIASGAAWTSPTAASGHRASPAKRADVAARFDSTKPLASRAPPPLRAPPGARLDTMERRAGSAPRFDDEHHDPNTARTTKRPAATSMRHSESPEASAPSNERRLVTLQPLPRSASAVSNECRAARNAD